MCFDVVLLFPILPSRSFQWFGVFLPAFRIAWPGVDALLLCYYRSTSMYVFFFLHYFFPVHGR